MVESNNSYVIAVAFFILFANIIVLFYYFLRKYFKSTDFYKRLKDRKKVMVERMSQMAMKFDHEDDEDYNADDAAPTPAERASFQLKTVAGHLSNVTNSAAAATRGSVGSLGAVTQKTVVTLVSNPIFDRQRKNSSSEKMKEKQDDDDDDNL